MNPIHETVKKIGLPQDARNRVLQGKRKRIPKKIWIPVVSAAAVLTAVILPSAGYWSGYKPVSKETVPEDHIVFNEADPASIESSLADSMGLLAVPVTEDELTIMNKVVLPYADARAAMFRAYLRRTEHLFLAEDEDFYAYQVFTSDRNDGNRWLNLFLSQSAERRPREMYEKSELSEEAEMSKISGTDVLLFRYENLTEAYLSHDGWHFDIWTKNVSEKEMTDCIRSIVTQPIALTPGKVNILEDLQAEESIVTGSIPETDGMDLYREADLAGMIHIVTTDTCFEKDGEVWTGGYFTLYQSYSEELTAQSSRYIRKGGILEKDGKYTQYLAEDDILAEPGCYLAFLKMTDSGEYEIIGGPDGLRLLKEYIPSFDRNRLSFMNNRTGEYETIVQILPDLDDYHEFFVY